MRFYQQCRALPGFFQRQLCAHIIAGVCLLAITGLFLCLRFGFVMLAPAMILFVFLLLHGAWLFRLAVRQQYIVVDGICTYIQRTAVRKRAKYLQLDVQGMCVQIASKRSHIPYHPQQRLRLYLTPQTPVYEKDGVQLLSNYLGIEAIPLTAEN